MRAIRITETGGPEVLTLTEAETPEPGPGLVLVKLAASGINFIDTYHRSGAYPMKLPLILGSEGAGEVVKVGDGVADVHVGDRVASTNFSGAYAENPHAPADRTVPVPDGLDLELAAAVLLQGMTAHYLLFDSYRVQPGDPVLVHAGAGGMGLLLTQLAAELGATVITTASTPEKAKLSSEAGAAHVLAYDDVPDKVKELTGGAGVAAAYDGVGRTTFEGSLASLRLRGSLVLYGYASGRPDPFDINRLQAGSYKLTRPTLGHFVVTRPELLERAEYVLQRVADGRLIVRIGHRYPLAEAAQAHRDLEGRKTTGKILLNP
jgi:NADPH2:quinone reductase